MPLCSNTARAAFVVAFCTMIVAFINWGLGLVFGAIFARKVAEHAMTKGQRIHYGIVGAAGYSGLMIWHGGLSGSAPIKVADSGHLASLMKPIEAFDVSTLPESSQCPKPFGQPTISCYSWCCLYSFL